MARRFEDLQAHLAELKDVAVLQRGERVVGLGPGPEIEACARPLPQLQVTGHEVGVEMGEEDVTYL